jgi:toxin-antitoxin system PIN domain toxin
MLIDANILLYAVDSSSRHHSRAASWLTERLNAPARMGMPWESLGAFLRLSTHPRAAAEPLAPRDAWAFVRDWLARPGVWTPTPTEDHADVLQTLIERYDVSGNLVPDAHLAALAIEHGLTVCSADTDFARFSEIRWENPLADGG